ncbi:hypothetical protein GCM10023093_04340 [Nemorincola caseinilytica]|uniref:Uncharacterized protein n=1 Tax=Nemorincola caseinilytica TaxID=2054315 RepID=A0ABP8N3W5_9BACT
MTFTDKHIIDAYSDMLKGLQPDSKLELIERLLRSVRKDDRKKERDFFRSYGAFVSDSSAEDIIKDIKANRKFSKKDIRL